MKCEICDNTGNNTIYQVREMMLGLRETFTYFQCSKCGCLQIENQPINMNNYYPKNYYSFSRRSMKDSKFKQQITRKRDLYVIECKKNYLFKIINKIKPASSFVKIVAETNINQESRILDVGTGYGSRMRPLINAGYNVTGIDPYIEKEEIEINGFKILKKDIYSIEGEWDLIMLNHVFEHLPAPKKVLNRIHKLMSKNGKCLIRIPIIPSYVWGEYKTDWVQIDAPRHFFIHSLQSFRLLIQNAGFQIEKIIYDSIPFQFTGSEHYKRDISIINGDFRLSKKNTIFTAKEIKYFKKQTKILNKSDQGDQAAFILSKKEL